MRHEHDILIEGVEFKVTWESNGFGEASDVMAFAGEEELLDLLAPRIQDKIFQKVWEIQEDSSYYEDDRDEKEGVA